MGTKALHTPEQDILSSIMRREIIDRTSPLISSDARLNPLSDSTDHKKLSALLKTYRSRIRDLLADLSTGEIPIRDFSSKIIEIRDEIHGDKDADGNFLRELEKIIFNIQTVIDRAAANVRRLMSTTEPDDAALLHLIDLAKQQISGATAQPSLPAPQHCKTHIEQPKSLQIIKTAGEKPVKDHLKYGPMLERFLTSRGIMDTSHPKMVAFYRLLANKPLGESTAKADIMTGTDSSDDGCLNALINRLKEKKLLLGRNEPPTTPGCFIQVKERDRKPSKTNRKQIGCYRYGLIIAI